MLAIFELVHKSNRTFNNLKPENIMINDNNNGNKFTVRLVDFGFADKYIQDSTGEHIKEKDKV